MSYYYTINVKAIQESTLNVLQLMMLRCKQISCTDLDDDCTYVCKNACVFCSDNPGICPGEFIDDCACSAQGGMKKGMQK